MIPDKMEIVDYNNEVLDTKAVQERIKKLKDLIEENKKLIDLRRDDAYLMRFLHSCRFDIRETYEKMENFYELLLEYPDWFHIGSPSEKKDLLNKNMRFILDDRDRQGRPIYLCKIGNINPSQVTVKQLVSVDDMWLEMTLEDPMTQSNGLCVIMDVSGYSLRLFQWLTPFNLKFGSKKIDCLPIKDMLIHVVNTSFLVDASVKIVWPFLPQRIKNGIIFHHTNWESLHKYINPNVLPLEYGGTSTISYEKLNENLIKHSSDIVERTKYINFIVSGK